MSIDPIITTNHIREKYIKYLESILVVNDENIFNEAKKKLEENSKFVKGPYIEITPPFVTGESINDLIKNNVLSKEFYKIKNSIDLDRPLYKHQVDAIIKIIKYNRNIVVASGTGSGKTECFLIPIMDYLMKQNERGTLNAGVRALLLYPMNALANDQMKRLRELLKNYPDITFGRYTGETLSDPKKALENFKNQNPNERHLENELLSRNEMRETPPNILLTNYAMLEYLLLRPEDNSFFDNNYGQQWRFIVLDEAHNYKGANGTEISMLINRVKERVNGCKKGEIKCIATSATLGRGKEDYPKVKEFAKALFDEEFDESDIIESKRKKTDISDNNLKLQHPEFYDELNENINRYQKSILSLEQFAEKYNLHDNNFKNIEQILYEILKDDKRLNSLRQELLECPKSLYDMSEKVFNDIQIPQNRKVELLIKLINASVKAKRNNKDNSLLPARYHLFVKALEGMYASLYPKKHVFLEHREKFKVNENLNVPVFEFANCQKCGQEYIIGYIDSDGYLKQTSMNYDEPNKKTSCFMITNDFNDNDIDIDEDESTLYKSTVSSMENWILCGACGKIVRANEIKKINCCNINDNKKYIHLKKIKSHNNANEINTCPACGSVSPNIIKKFLSSNEAATNVLARSLYEMIPPKADNIPQNNEEDTSESFFSDMFNKQIAATNENKTTNENGRKLLIFSDNRQEAAFFAAYLNNKYNLIQWRKILLNSLDDFNNDIDIRIDDVANIMVRKAENALMFDNTLSYQSKKKIAYLYLMKEFISFERSTDLEGIGLIKISPVKCMNLKMGYEKLGLDTDDFWKLICVLLDSLRFSGAVTFPTEISPYDETFEPRNREVCFRCDGSKNLKGVTILGWLPSENAENKRSNYIKRILIKNGYSNDEAKEKSIEILKNIYKGTKSGFEQLKYYVTENKGEDGIVDYLNYKMWNIQKRKLNDDLYRCNRCGKITNYNIKNICPEFRCSGELVKVKDYNNKKNDYYTSLYDDRRIIPMVSKEHTAQLKSDTATDLQNKFEKGKVNVLSCSTTFEMGVDVGQLEAIFMRNVPPETSNYIQRAGRAGRRTESTAFVLTYARRRSHDLNYFYSPEKMISGKIQPPYIEKNNDKIIKRHLNSIVFAYFFRKYPDYFKNVENLFGFNTGDSAVIKLREMLNNHPQDLLESIKKVIPQNIFDKLKINDWGFIEDICGKDGSFTKSEEELKSTINNLEDIKKNNFQKGLNVDYIQKIINTYLQKQTIDFLSSKNVLPKYGFPVDVVELSILSNSPEAKKVQLTRDLKMAITEFAPGSKVVASGKIWTSYSVNMVTNKGWPTYEYTICPKCNKLYIKETDLNKNIESQIPDVCTCGEKIEIKRKFIIPVFGFSTSIKGPENPGENKPPKYYATQIAFSSYGKLDENEEKEVTQGELKAGHYNIQYKYSPQGKLVLINRGIKNRGFAICKYCGYATPITEKGNGIHYNKYGEKCPNKNLYYTDLGHYFSSDVLELKLPVLTECSEKLWLSVLYAILEGASNELDIVRSDINGCLYYDAIDINVPSLILFDETAGGAGHVKKISQNIIRVLNAALEKVSGRCGCGEETSCYGCLRNYENQIYHEKLVRGLAKDYLIKLIK